ncbi:methyltransferase domain-containing protein [Isoptericola sp. NEAU-Y5]|uniref:Methyltransferase domain-containing protein n=1 Tax=Isoptericola luteus TaxID=2879484 RepID=A0ABS7ZII8_9MICO|nr:class I SAM-dependent methyltransferase [Isoptericola sp. NEAU-Y5]MCA5894827.1 methyltransferase domain-containing protein [Isoptericola sp. NEAU-Y5]
MTTGAPSPASRPVVTGADPTSPADRAASFERGADVYAAVRPSYPPEAVDWLLPPGARRVLDLGAGTGKLTTALSGRGLDVVAVEPSPGMLGRLRHALPEIEAHLGTAETIPLPDASVDAVVVGQAWHWFDEERAPAEIARVLRPGGQVAVIFNDRDHTVDWVARFGEILHRGDRLEPNPARGAAGPRLGASFGDVERATFTWADLLRTTALRPLASSRSYLLTLPDDERDALLDDVDTLVATHPALAGRDRVDLPYVTHAYRARRR